MDGLRYGDNTKAAVIRLGLMEMVKFAELFYPGSQLSTFFESCGIADLVTTCYGGRNRKVSEAFVKTKKVSFLFKTTITTFINTFNTFVQTIAELEKEMLNGQALQGPQTAEEVNHMLKSKNSEDRYFSSRIRIPRARKY